MALVDRRVMRNTGSTFCFSIIVATAPATELPLMSLGFTQMVMPLLHSS